MSEFKREPRYVVFKLTDIGRYLTQGEQESLMCIGDEIAQCRADDGRPPFNAVVVEQDWPEFEPVWEMIEARMTGSPVPSAPDVYVDQILPLVLEVCNDWVSFGLPSTEAINAAFLDSTGDRGKYPKPLDALVRLVTAAAKKHPTPERIAEWEKFLAAAKEES